MCIGFVEEMYVLSSRNKRVSIQLLGKDKIEDKLSRFEELTSAALSYLGVSSCESADDISSTLPSELFSSPCNSCRPYLCFQSRENCGASQLNYAFLFCVNFFGQLPQHFIIIILQRHKLPFFVLYVFSYTYF